MRRLLQVSGRTGPPGTRASESAFLFSGAARSVIVQGVALLAILLGPTETPPTQEQRGATGIGYTWRVGYSENGYWDRREGSHVSLARRGGPRADGASQD